MSDNREKLEDERWKLMNSFGLTPSQDGLVTTPAIQPISHVQMERDLVLSIRRSRREREREAAQMLAEFSRFGSASNSSVRRR